MLVAICDDETADREKAGAVLAQKMKNRKEDLKIKYFNSGEDLVEQYENGCPEFDLIFMDIYLQHMNGFETVRQIRQYDQTVAVIFLTSSPDFAVESYDVRASGYLLKPIEQEKLENAVNRFLEERYPRTRQSLLMVNGHTGRRISYNDIMYIESQRMNLRIVCCGSVEHIIRKKLDEVQAELTQSRFLRCNQSFIVNMDHITYADTDFVMENGDRIPIKVRERKRIREQYFAYILERGWENII